MTDDNKILINSLKEIKLNSMSNYSANEMTPFIDENNII